MGKNQVYEQGKYFRQRYINLTNNGEYSANKVYVLSADDDRTLMSAEVALAGFFPPHGHQIWNDHLLWQPIPIHSIPGDLDYLLQECRPCPMLDLKLGEYYKTNEYQRYIIEKIALSAFIEKRTNTTASEADYIFEELNVEELDNLKFSHY